MILTQESTEESILELLTLLLRSQQQTTADNSNSSSIKKNVPTSPNPPQNLSSRPGPPYPASSPQGTGAFSALLESMLQQRPGEYARPPGVGGVSTADIVLGGIASSSSPPVKRRPVAALQPASNVVRPGKKASQQEANFPSRYII